MTVKTSENDCNVELSDSKLCLEIGSVYDACVLNGVDFKQNKDVGFRWFRMKLKLVGGDSAGVVTAYYIKNGAGSTRDELDFEFLGNRTGQPYLLQTNLYKNRTCNREMRHMLWKKSTNWTKEWRFHSTSDVSHNHQ
ncbi:putative xyloglucan endotransglucosylase/hydrolase protein [Trifolium repens]|nr:putative xyloglucan endotransglucosylase/hydrolase protein [Trifolium repens]